MADTNIDNKVGSVQEQSVVHVLDAYTTDSLIQVVSDWQKAHKGVGALADNNVVVFPNDDVLEEMVRKELYSHLLNHSSDPFRNVDLSDTDQVKLLDEHHISAEKFKSALMDVAEDLKRQFGIAALSAVEVEPGVLHFDIAHIPIAVPAPSIDASVSSVFVLDKREPDCSHLIALVGEGQELLGQSAPPPPLPVDPDVPVVAGLSDLELLGAGGMGRVYTCTIVGNNEQESRKGVVKVVQSHLRNQMDIRTRFDRESDLLEKAAMSTQHAENFPAFLGRGVDENGVPYFVQELVPGVDLHQEISKSQLLRMGARSEDPEMQRDDLQALHAANQEILTLYPGMLRALGDMHASGIIHRDLKPPNIVCVRDPDTGSPERLVILDFGLAKRIHDPPSRVNNQETVPVAGVDERLTSPHFNVGTPTYMSPEQCTNRGATTKSDVFAAGLTLYRHLTGSDALFGELEGMLMNYVEVQRVMISRKFSTMQRQKEQVDPAARLHPHMYKLIKSMLEKNPKKRPSMNEAADKLEQHLADPSVGYMDRLRHSWDMSPSIGAFAVSMFKGFPIDNE